MKVILISNNINSYCEIKKNLPNIDLNFFNGLNYPSFSKLVNDAVMSVPDQFVTIISDRVRPTEKNIQILEEKLNEGYGFSSLYYFACFAVNKQIFKKTGFLDERFIRGGYEDFDFMIRMGMHKIPIFMREDVHYIPGETRWNKKISKLIWLAKWSFPPQIGWEIPVIGKHMNEEVYPYDLSNIKDIILKSYEDSSYVGTKFYFELYQLGNKVNVDSKFD